MLKYLTLVFGIVFFLSARAWAIAAETTRQMNLGTYIQTAATASGVLSYGSSMGSLSGLVVGSSSTKAAAIVNVSSTKGRESVDDVLMRTSTVTLSNTVGCTITVRSFTFSSTWFDLRSGNSEDVDIGATVNISGGFCEEGTYSGTATVEIDGNKGTPTADFTISITLEAPLDIAEVTGMNFGSFMPPNTASTVILTPSGTYSTTGNVVFVDTGLTSGEFTVTGVGSRTVNIVFPSSATITNGNTTMNVDTFTSTPSGSFTMGGTGTGKTQSIKTGATLHINKSQKLGAYTGTYPVIVSY